MKKLLFSLFIAAFFFCSCQSDNLSNIGSGVKTANNICHQLSGPACKLKDVTVIDDDDNSNDNDKTANTLLPEYAWEMKMMVK